MGKKWAQEKEDFLRENFSSLSLKELASNLKCSKKAVISKSRKLGLTETKEWSLEEIEIIKKNYEFRMISKILKLLPGRNSLGIINEARKLKLSSFFNTQTDMIKQLINNGLNDKNISKIIDCSVDTIIQYRYKILSQYRRGPIIPITKEEENIIKQYYKFSSYEELQKLLPNRTIRWICEKGREFKIKRANPNHIWTQEEENLLIKEYSNKWAEELKSIFPNKVEAQIRTKAKSLKLIKITLKPINRKICINLISKQDYNNNMVKRDGFRLTENTLQLDWTEDEINILKENYKLLRSGKLASILNRSINAIHQKANELCLRKQFKWTWEELDILKNNFILKTKEELLILLPLHNFCGIKQKARRLGFKKVKDNSRKERTQELINNGLSDKKIGSIMNCSANTIKRYRQDHLKQFKRKKYVIWAEEEIVVLKQHYSYLPYKELQKLLPNRSIRRICEMGRELGIKRPNPKFLWKQEEIDLLVKEYPNKLAQELKFLFPTRTAIQIKNKAKTLKLVKTPEVFLKSLGEGGVKALLEGKLGNTWRSKILRRDNFTCAECGLTDQSGCALHAHHIVPRRDPNCEKYKIRNGICLCKGCHNKIHLKEYEYIEKYANNVVLK